VEVVDIREFTCCGYPLRNTDFTASILCAARNLALAERQELEMLILCKCGFGMLKYTASLMEENQAIRKDMNALLKAEGLALKGPVGVKHLLSVLYHDVGVEGIKEKVTRPYQELKIATHYGCHALRPSEITHFDDPVNPTLFDALVTLTGAESISWQARLECCGAPLFGVHDELSMDLTQRKLTSARGSGAQFLCTACPYCHIQFDTVQRMIQGERGGDHLLPPILYPQLLGLSMGIEGERLGLGMNEIEISPIEGFLSR
jgi:heterodisulfide reductase subunit B